MKLEIIKKAWSINPSNIEEPWFVDTDLIYYGTRGQAKYKALVDYDTCNVVDSDEWLTYLTIRVQRRKECDIVDYHGRHIKRYEIANVEREIRIQNLPEDKSYYIQDRRSFLGNSVVWWALNGCGYTSDITKAQKYTKDEVARRSWRDTDIIWFSDHVEQHIKQHVDSQYLENEFKV